jgi:nucleotide-binding universal stress UspA family protein
MTRSCEKAVRYGVSLARRYHAELFVMHVFHNLFGLEGWNIPMISFAEEYRKDLEKEKKALHEIIRKENDTGMAIKELIKEGEPTEEIFKTVEAEKIDLMILLAHEEGRLEHFLFGRSNEEIVRRMPCSVLLVKKRLPSLSD